MTLGVDPDDRMAAARPEAGTGWQRHLGALVRVGVVLVVLGAAGASSWPYIKEHFLPSAAPSGPLPVIGPGDQPIKEPPKQPGGMQVPDQDKIILNGAAAQPKVEQILPPPPAPLSSPTPPTPAATAAPESPAPASPAPAPATPPAMVTSSPPGSPTAAAAAPPPKPPRVIEAPAPQVVIASPSPPSPRMAAPQPQGTPVIAHESVPPEFAGRGWFVQLGAVRSTAAAQAEWTRLKGAHADLLAPLKANAVRVDRNGTVLYRIEAGPLADAGAASHLCRSLQERHVACIVLRP